MTYDSHADPARTPDRSAATGQPAAQLMCLGLRVAGLGLGAIDYGCDTITLDDRAATLFDLPARSAIARSALHARIHEGDLPHVTAAIARLYDVGGPGFVDVVHRVRTDDHSLRWLSARKQVIFDSADPATRRPVSGLVAIMDISAQKRAETRIIDLMREMNHRQKNLLTVVQSIARLTARTAAPDAFIASFTTRLQALAHNQDLLLQRGTDGVMLAALVHEQLEPFTPDMQTQFRISGPDVALSYDAIQPIGLALHELATNALKYGALSVSDGVVQIDWDITGDRFCLRWTESGGPAVSPPTRKGFGTTVLQSMTRSALNADVVLDHAPSGLHWQMTCPVSRVHPSGTAGQTPA